MRIKEIRELSVPLVGSVANSLVNFSEHTVSLVAVVTDVVREGRQVVGLSFNSIGRYAQPGLMRERFIPRLMSCSPTELIGQGGATFDCDKARAVMMRNEKPGGHGDRAAAVAAIELALWDANAKVCGEPAYVNIAKAFGRTASTRVPVYAAGGYYYDSDSTSRLQDELRRYQDKGFSAYKIKIGGASLSQDICRIEAALAVAGDGERLAVDANGRFGRAEALAYGEALKPLQLRWYEEVCDPLNFGLNRDVINSYGRPVATGENLFSLADLQNLISFGGMRSKLDIFQMDAGLSYGLGEYARMIDMLENHGFSRAQAFPHGGHLINLHIVAALGLGGCEAYPGVFQPFGGYPQRCKLGDGFVSPTDAPGFGLEEKEELRPVIAKLLEGLAW